MNIKLLDIECMNFAAPDSIKVAVFDLKEQRNYHSLRRICAFEIAPTNSSDLEGVILLRHCIACLLSLL